MSDPINEWPMPRYRTANRDYLHALGVITLNFNRFESILFRLFAHHLDAKLDLNISWNLYSQLQDAKKKATTLDMYETCERDPIIIEHVKHVLDFFNCCETNRNHLFHSQHRDGWDSTDEDILHLTKDVKGRWDVFNYIPIALPDLRRIADDMFIGWDYAWSVWAYLVVRDRTLASPLVAFFPGTLPDKPALPPTLNPSQHHRSQAGPPSQ